MVGIGHVSATLQRWINDGEYGTVGNKWVFATTDATDNRDGLALLSSELCSGHTSSGGWTLGDHAGGDGCVCFGWRGSGAIAGSHGQSQQRTATE
jgi:hypothetical protein